MRVGAQAPPGAPGGGGIRRGGGLSGEDSTRRQAEKDDDRRPIGTKHSLTPHGGGADNVECPRMNTVTQNDRRQKRELELGQCQNGKLQRSFEGDYLDSG